MKNFNIVFKYIIFSLLFLIFAVAENQKGYYIFSVALLFSLAYCRQNVLILLPIYVICGMCVELSIFQLVITAIPPILLLVVYFTHFKLKKSIKVIHVNIYSFLAQIPLFFFYSSDIYLVLSLIISILGTQIFIYCAINVTYAFLERGLSSKFRSDEIYCFLLFLGVIGFALSGIHIFGFYPIYAVAIVLTVLSLIVDKSLSIFVGLALGIGAAVGSMNTGLGLNIIIPAVSAYVVYGKNIYLPSAIMVGVDMAFLFFFGAKNVDILRLISPITGMAIVFLMPKMLKNYLKGVNACHKNKVATRSVINRNRQEISKKLKNLSSIFYEIQDILYSKYDEIDKQSTIENLSSEVSAKCCSVCINYENCCSYLGGTTTHAIADLVESAINNGKVTILDITPFISARCKKVSALIASVNEVIFRYNAKKSLQKDISEGKSMIAEQMGGVGQIMDNLSIETSLNVNYDTALELRLIEELSYSNIICSDALIYGDGEMEQINLIIRKIDFAKSNFLETINKILGRKYLADCVENTLNGTVSVNLQPSPNYNLAYGVTSQSKIGGELCGDSTKILKISHTKIMLILSDGMGSGNKAYTTSQNAISIIENFYKVGFDHQTILSLVNKLLSARQNDDFNAIDIVIFDTISGHSDFIKLGGRESYVFSQKRVDVIECGSLPMGILDDVNPIIEQKHLSVGDFIILISDGIADFFPPDLMTDLLMNMKTLNPQVVADQILQNASALCPTEKVDDSTVLVARVVKD